MGSSTGKELNIETAALTDPGLVRGNNEDSVFLIDKRESNAFGSETFGIYLVADGMGGHLGGEVASETAMRTISTTLLDKLKSTSESRPPSLLLKQAIERAHNDILDVAGSKPELRSMGTTVTVGLRLDFDLYLGHVGDSRAYLIRENRIRQLTEDHSVVALLLKRGAITPREARTHPDKGKILRCLGITRDVTIDTFIRDNAEGKLTLRGRDALVFCSDGLTDYVSDGEILNCVSRRSHPGEACRDLIDMANSRGGGDNTSVIIVRVRS